MAKVDYWIFNCNPEYEKNGWLYISYSYFDDKDKSRSNTALIRANLEKDQLINIETLYRGIPTVKTRYHYGSRIEFDPEGYLYFSIGDRGKRDIFPQTLDNSNGKVHRFQGRWKHPFR
jgi:glucose/arabinose dehydrogenase